MAIPKHVSSVSVLEYAAMSEDVYRHPHQPLYHVLETCGWSRLRDLPIKDTKGFFARLYSRAKDNITVLAYRGSDFTYMDNYAADINLAKNIPSIFLEYAWETYQAVKTTAKPIAFTGHSLGGYLAQYMAICAHKSDESVCAIAFNAPHVGGLKPGPTNRLGFVDPNHDYPYILNYHVEHDLVSQVGQKIGVQHVLPGNPDCSPEAFEARRAARAKFSFGARPLPPADLGSLGVCIKGEHVMETLLAKLWEYDEKLSSLPVKPVQS